MGLPKVDINIINGQLASIPANTDGIMGLMMSGTATDDLALYEGKAITGVKDLEALGMTAETHASVFRHVQEFYSEGRDGLELWIALANPTVTMTNLLDVNNNYAKKLVTDSGYRVRVLCVTREPDEEYEPTITAGLDGDCYTALTKAHELATYFASINAPIRALVEARSFNGNASNLTDLHTLTKNRAGLVLFSSDDDGSSSAGLFLGRTAANPVQRKPSRPKDGSLPLDECFAGAQDISAYSGVTMIHDKGFITARTFVGKTGFYISDDPMAVALTDDFASLSHGRIIDKAHRIAYVTYVEELNDEVHVDSNGRIAPGTIKALEAKIETAINLQMSGEIGVVTCYIDPAQNVISTNKLVVKLSVTPFGYSKDIEVNLGFLNPALNN